jgi:carboxylate-amine ligase
MVAFLRLGVEEEYPLVDRRSRELAPGFDAVMRRATDEIKERVRPEFYQCVIETRTPACGTIEDARRWTKILRATVAQMAHESHLAIVATSTHPKSRWDRQRRTSGSLDPNHRYEMLEDELQDVVRTLTFCGLHVHVEIKDRALRIAVMNQVRAFLPLILALSVNSPFWQGRPTGYQSYRTMVWAPYPLANVPDPFESLQDYEDFYSLLQRTESLAKSRKIWWDVRPHPDYKTLEFRIADMPLNHADTMAIVAFIQALVQTIIERTTRSDPLPIVPTRIINENKWRVARWGLRGKLIEYPGRGDVPTRDLLAEALELIRDAAQELGADREMAHLHSMLQPGYLTGAERQYAAYKEHRGLNDVVDLLVAETMRDIDPGAALPLKPRSFWDWFKG